MSDDRPKIRRYRNPRYDVSAGDMSLWEALRDHASTADEDPARVAGHRYSAAEIREVLDTIAQLRWDLGTTQRDLGVAQAKSGVQRGAKEVAEGAAIATMAALEKAKRERDEALGLIERLHERIERLEFSNDMACGCGRGNSRTHRTWHRPQQTSMLWLASYSTPSTRWSASGTRRGP